MNGAVCLHQQHGSDLQSTIGFRISAWALDIACMFAVNLDSVLFASVACMCEQWTDAGAYISQLL
jgi:hypothetical protein